MKQQDNGTAVPYPPSPTAANVYPPRKTSVKTVV